MNCNFVSLTLNACKKILIILGASLLFGCGSDGGSDNSGAQHTNIDLIPYARITASATRNYRPSYSAPYFPFPNDLQSGIMAINDDSPYTWWKAPLTGNATIEIDLAPLFGSPIVMNRLEVDPSGSGSAEIDISLSSYCGGPVTRTLHMGSIEKTLSLEDISAQCVTLNVIPEGVFGFSGISLYGGATEPTHRLVPEAVSTHHGYGVIEGFYGFYWSWRERENIVRAIAAAGLDTYIYAPKSDPLHRINWRDPYDEEFISSFRQLVELGQSLGVRVYFGLSPFADIDYADPLEKQILIGKLKTFIDVGVNSVMLLADDIFRRGISTRPDAALGQVHAIIVADIYDELRLLQADLHLIFVPTVYNQTYADSSPEGWAYLQALASLPSDIDIVWTGQGPIGPGQNSPEMIPDDLRAVAAVINRKPFIWDNFFTNNFNNGRIRLNPLLGRSADIRPTVSGYVINPMNQGSLSRLLSNYLSWTLLCDIPGECGGPIEYAADAEAQMGIDISNDAELDAQILAQITPIFSGHRGLPELTNYQDLDATVELFVAEVADFSRPSVQTIMQLQALFGSIVGAGSEVHHSRLEPGLVDELYFPLQSARALGQAGLAIIELLRMKFAGRDTAAQVSYIEGLLSGLSSFRYELSPGVLAQLFASVQSLASDNSIDWSGNLLLRDNADCQTGVAFSWEPFGENWVVNVSGLPGASSEEELVKWMPNISGHYSGVITAFRTGPSGVVDDWAHKEFELVCH